MATGGWCARSQRPGGSVPLLLHALGRGRRVRRAGEHDARRSTPDGAKTADPHAAAGTGASRADPARSRRECAATRTRAASQPPERSRDAALRCVARNGATSLPTIPLSSARSTERTKLTGRERTARKRRRRAVRLSEELGRTRLRRLDALERQNAHALASINRALVQFGFEQKLVAVNGIEAHLISSESASVPLDVDVMDDLARRQRVGAAVCQHRLVQF